MAKLDALIEKLLKESALELILQAGVTPSLRTEKALTPIMKVALSGPQIVGALMEIVPSPMKATFPTEGETQFDYVVALGTVTVNVDKQGPVIRASIVPTRPVADEEPALELDLPPMVVQLAAEPVRPPLQIRANPSADPASQMADLLDLMLKMKSSDLHLSSGNSPSLRIDGDIVPQSSYGTLTSERLQELIWSIAPDKNKEEWTRVKDTDFAHETSAARFRVNVFADRKGMGAVLRQIPNTILSAEQMGLPKAVLDLCFLTKGLVLVTGPTGSGKSTTLAAMIDYINRNREDHIITIEDPIEFVHPNKKCLVNQREIGTHTGSFKHALRAALREDPDIVLVGEMRDLETIAIAIETAETGHLVFGTLHTNTAPSTVDRIIDQFPADRQSQIRVMLSESLKGVIAQNLCKKIGGGRVPALEILICTGSVANLIREGKTFQLQSIMQTGKSHGMTMLNDSLLELVKKQVIEPKEAYMKSVSKAEMKAVLERSGFKIELGEAIP